MFFILMISGNHGIISISPEISPFRIHLDIDPHLPLVLVCPEKSFLFSYTFYKYPVRIMKRRILIHLGKCHSIFYILKLLPVLSSLKNLPFGPPICLSPSHRAAPLSGRQRSPVTVSYSRNPPEKFLQSKPSWSQNPVCNIASQAALANNVYFFLFIQFRKSVTKLIYRNIDKSPQYVLLHTLPGFLHPEESRFRPLEDFPHPL